MAQEEKSKVQEEIQQQAPPEVEGRRGRREVGKSQWQVKKVEEQGKADPLARYHASHVAACRHCCKQVMPSAAPGRRHA
jgi:hypothetical protein